MKFITTIFLCLLIGCSATQPVASPCPACPPPTTITKNVHDTLYETVDSLVERTVQVDHYVLSDTMVRDIVLNPVAGDSYEMLQDAINLCIDFPGHRIILNPGNYYISKGILAAKILNGVYQQVNFDLEGYGNAKNSPVTASIILTDTAGFALSIQQGKGCVIKNIAFFGQYYFPGTLSILSLDTLPTAAWDVGVRTNRTSPYAGLVIDPFSDPWYYTNGYQMYPGLEDHYLPGMNTSGSTDITIDGCGFYNFLVGTAITPSFQANGELINVVNCHYEKCKSAYAFNQAQSKSNTFRNIEAWSMIRTVIDGDNYGPGRGDGSTCPVVENLNCAGGIFQIMDVNNVTLSCNMSHVFAEYLYRIGQASGTMGMHFQDWQIDFQTDIGVPTPDHYFPGPGIFWDNCTFRRYTGSPERLIIAMPDNYFRGGSFSGVPAAYMNPADNMFYQPGSGPGGFDRVRLVPGGGWLNGAGSDTTIPIPGHFPVRIDRSSFTGYVLLSDPRIAAGDFLLTQKWYDGTTVTTFEYPLGVVTAVSADTVFLSRMGSGIHDGEVLTIFDNKVKTSL